MLCSKCQQKVKSGVVSSKYIEVSKKLLEFEGQNQFLQTVNLENVIDAGSFLVLVVAEVTVASSPSTRRSPGISETPSATR
jgi:hypothetical protein